MDTNRRFGHAHDPLAVLEGGYTDVVHVKLTQIPTANVDAVVAEQSGRNVVLADQGVNPSAHARR